MAEIELVTLARFFHERRALLWVGQPYDLLPGEQSHEYDVAETEAALKYRKDPNPDDEAITRLYWEAVWLEGARSPLLASLRKQQEDRSSPRKIVVLASEADAKASVNSSEFLPVFALAGLIDDSSSVPAGSRYDPSRRRTRDRVAWDLSSRLVEFPQRLLVVVGPPSTTGLANLFDVLSEKPILDLTVLVIMPPGAAELAPPQNPAVRLFTWIGSVGDFAKALENIEAPKAGELPEWAIRVGKKTVKLSERDVARIREHFAVLTERMLLPPDQFALEDLHDFFQGNIENWKAYAHTVGLPIDRAYRTESNRTLADTVISQLRNAHSEADMASFFYLKFPCQTGSGATTMLRRAAFCAALEGFPTLVFRSDRVSLDPEEVTAFASILVEKCLDQEVGKSPVLLIVFDVEHEPLTNLNKLGQTLAAAGRTVVILQAIKATEEHKGEVQGRSARLLSVLRADATGDDVTQCREVLNKIVSQWSLGLQVPDQAAWNNFSDSSKFVDSSTGEDDQGSKFWVALWFFLTKEMDFVTGERFRDALGRWIERRSSQITSSAMMDVLTYVAALSSFRLASPLWTVLRPATGGAFNSDLTPTLKQMDGIVEWGPLQQKYEDHILRFVHPTIAVEFLRQKGIRGEKNCFNLIRPLIESLSPGHPADVWLSETLANVVLAPKFEERFYGDWDWRIKAFSFFPQQLSRQSKTILHHWARCLYLSADEKHAQAWQMGAAERQKRVKESIDLLRKALNLPQRFGRDEHPSHLFNTLGTAYSRLAALLESTPSPDETPQHAWDQCCKYFDESIRLAGRTNVEALLAFAKRRLEHWQRTAKSSQPATSEQIEELVEALSLLDEAQEVIENLPTPDIHLEEDVSKNKFIILNAIDSAKATDFLDQLKKSQNPDIGYYCQAQLLLKDKADQIATNKALDTLLEAKNNGVKLGHRSLHLLLALIRNHPSRRFEFALLQQLYSDLERLPGYTTRPIDQFWHAVICYQTGDYLEGSQRFSKLREQSRHLDNFRLRVRAVLTDRNHFGRPREVVARVTRIISEFRAEAFVEDLGQKVNLRPRHFTPMPRTNEAVLCVIRFEANGPLAVPPRFEAAALKSVSS